MIIAMVMMMIVSRVPQNQRASASIIYAGRMMQVNRSSLCIQSNTGGVRRVIRVQDKTRQWEMGGTVGGEEGVGEG